MYNSSAKHKIWLGISPTRAQEEGARRDGRGSYQLQKKEEFPAKLLSKFQREPYQTSDLRGHTSIPTLNTRAANPPKPSLRFTGNLSKTSEPAKAAISTTDILDSHLEINDRRDDDQKALVIEKTLSQKPELVKAKSGNLPLWKHLSASGGRGIEGDLKKEKNNVKDN